MNCVSGNKFERRIGFFQGLGVGSVAGISAFGATLPMDFIKQYVQSGHNWKEAVNVVRRDGMGVMWRGLGVGGGAIAPQMAIKFGIYNGLHKVGWVKDIGITGDFGAGFVAGFVDGTFLGIPSTIQAAQQMNTKVGVGGSLDMIKSVGSGRFMIPLAMRNGSYTMFMLGGLYPTRRYLFKDSDSLSSYMFHTFVASSLLNVGGCLLSSPWDVIRADQADNLIEKKGSTTVRGVYKEIMMRDGLRGFYRGFGVYLITFGIRFPLTVFLAEMMKNGLFDSK